MTRQPSLASSETHASARAIAVDDPRNPLLRLENFFDADSVDLITEPDASGALAARGLIAGTPAEGYAACCEALATADLRAELGAIKASTLAIAGADDPATPPDRLAEIVDAVPDGRLEVVGHAAHLANAQQPQEITPLLLEHLEHS